MKYYTYIVTGKRYTEEQLREYFNIFNNIVTSGPVMLFHDAIDQLVSEKWLSVNDDEEPSVVMYLNDGLKVHAIKRYRDIHGCGLRKAKHMVELIEEDIAAIRKGEKRPWQV